MLVALAACAAAPSAASAQGYYSPENSPPGANDFACKPTAEHPEPVVLVHGLGANMQGNWGYISPRLADAGYCVFALTYGRKLDNPPPFDQNGGLAPMEESAVELADFVDEVLAATGASQVDIVGHSEGSLMPNYYVKFLPQARHEDGSLKVDDYIGMTPLWDGSNLAGLGTIRRGGEAEWVERAVRGARAPRLRGLPAGHQGIRLHERDERGPDRPARGGRHLHDAHDHVRRARLPVHERLHGRRDEHRDAGPVPGRSVRPRRDGVQPERPARHPERARPGHGTGRSTARRCSTSRAPRGPRRCAGRAPARA